jgi:hypothetical protein
MSEDRAIYEVTARPREVINFEEYAMSSEGVLKQVSIIQDVMRGVMHQDEHYGTIPGTKKPSLFKPGAEKLSLVFRLRPEYEIRRTELFGGHREYEVVCTLYHIPTGQSVGQGVGSATTMEGKYRYRGGEKEGTGQPIPTEYWNLKNAGRMNEAQALIGGPGFGVGKIDGKKWEICEIGEKQEHDNPADYYNTILKMAKKRAHVDAILTATAASDIFTQDVEDMPEVIPGAKQEAPKEPLKEPKKKEPNGGKSEVKDPNAPSTEQQQKAIHSLLTVCGLKDDLERMEKVTALAGIDGEAITSTTALTKGQASKVIEALGAEADAKRKAG